MVQVVISGAKVEVVNIEPKTIKDYLDIFEKAEEEEVVCKQKVGIEVIFNFDVPSYKVIVKKNGLDVELLIVS